MSNCDRKVRGAVVKKVPAIPGGASVLSGLSGSDGVTVEPGNRVKLGGGVVGVDCLSLYDRCSSPLSHELKEGVCWDEVEPYKNKHSSLTLLC